MKKYVLFPAILSLIFTACASYPHAGVDQIKQIHLETAKIAPESDGYRIIFVSDIHFGNNFSPRRLDRLVSAINSLEPDCIILGGDLTLGYPEIRTFAQQAQSLRARDGVYAVLGNHDFYNGRRETITYLRKAGIVVLDETAIKTPGGVMIAGINDFRDVFPVMNRLHEIQDKKEFTILVSHEPDFAEKTDLSFYDLVLSGHTHGGQITFFGYAPVIPSEYGQKYRTGTVIKDGVPVIISNGAGYGGNILRFRLFAPSDFLLITLHATVPMSDR